MKECKNCQKTYDDNSMFCTECGGRLEESAPRGSFCPNCGTACPAGAAFCTNCGTRLGAPAQAPVYAQPAQAPVYAQPAPQPAPQRPDVTLTESADDIESVPEEFRGKLKKAKAKHTRSKVLGGINAKIENETDLIRAVRENVPIKASGSYYTRTTKQKIGKLNNVLVYSFWFYNKGLALLKKRKRRAELLKTNYMQ